MATQPPSQPPRQPLSDRAADDTPVPLSQLERAINRARQAQPSQGFEAALAQDVSALGRIYGRLIWRRVAAFRRADLDDDERGAWDRWSD